MCDGLTLLVPVVSLVLVLAEEVLGAGHHRIPHSGVGSAAWVVDVWVRHPGPRSGPTVGVVVAERHVESLVLPSATLAPLGRQGRYAVVEYINAVADLATSS